MSKENRETLYCKITPIHHRALVRMGEKLDVFLSEAVELAIEKLCNEDSELNEYCVIRDKLKRLETK